MTRYPCALGGAIITVANVNAQDSLITFDESNDSITFTSTTFFVPRCNFSQPDEGTLV